jgi:hypothetical protein
MTHVAQGLTKIYFSHILFIYFKFVSLEIVENFWLFDNLVLLSMNRYIYFIWNVFR